MSSTLRAQRRFELVAIFTYLFLLYSLASFPSLDFNNYHFNYAFPGRYDPLIFSFFQSTSLKNVLRPGFPKGSSSDHVTPSVSNTSIATDSFTWALMIFWSKHTFPIFRSWSRVEFYHYPAILEVFGSWCSLSYSLPLSLFTDV